MNSDNPCNIQIEHYPVGKDNLFLITGGVEHIGAIATAYWYQRELHLSLGELPDHKEGELASECAELAAKTLSSNCTVVMGIHIDDASNEDINRIINYVRIEIRRKLLNLNQ